MMGRQDGGDPVAETVLAPEEVRLAEEESREGAANVAKAHQGESHGVGGGTGTRIYERRGSGATSGRSQGSASAMGRTRLTKSW